jgi:hypothetical protein
VVKSIIFIENIVDLETIPKKLINDSNNKKISLDYEVHNKLKLDGIEHQMGEELLNQDERLKIFDKVTEFRNWYSKLPSSEYIYEGVNILKLADSHEFHSFLMPKILNFIIIKKIIENEKLEKIYSTNKLSKIIEILIQDKNIETEFFIEEVKEELFWDKVSINYKIWKIPISITLSQNTYQKIKNYLEIGFGVIYNYWLNKKEFKKKGVILLEFNPEHFSSLLEEMKNYDGNLILVNQRRTPIWSKKSRDALKKSKCKILKLNSILNESEKSDISLLSNEYSKKIKKLWSNDKFFEELFKIENHSFWKVIDTMMIQTYEKKLSKYIEMIKSVKKVFDMIDVRCIVSLNEVGETEKVFLEVNKGTVPSIVLEHGFLERISKTKRFDVIGDYVNFKDKIAVWGNEKKNWLLSEYNINEEKILVTGSPRHDKYFKSKIKTNYKKNKTILLAPNPISDISGLSSTELKLRVTNVIKKIILNIEERNDVKIIVKIHHARLKHNEEIKELIKRINPTIPVLLWDSVIDTINSVDAVVVISPEIYGTSTMLLESMILDKPALNIYFDKEIPKYEHVKQNAILTITDSDNIEENLEKILYDKEIISNLSKNASNFLTKFMSNQGNASKQFALKLQSY